MEALGEPFDVVFVHRGLPDSTCDEIARAARVHADVAIILMSSERSERAEKNKLRLGADEIVYKPLDPLELRAIVERHLKVERKPLEVPCSPRILVVDDDEMVLRSVTDILKRKFEVTATQSPQEALRILQATAHQILLVDLMMEEMYGMDLIRAATNIHPSILAIVMTGYASKDTAVEALKEGAYDFLEKPFTPEIVTQTVVRAWKGLRTELENRKLLAELRRTNEELKNEIVEHKRAEEQLEKFRLKLEEMVDQRTLELKEALENLKRTQSQLLQSEKMASAAAESEKKRAAELEKAYKELRETQAKLIQVGKLAAMGTLGAGIAHQLNQPLTGIRLFAQILEMQIDKNNPLREDLYQIIEQTQYMADIIDNIRGFARVSEIKKAPIDIHEPMEKSLQLVSEQLKAHKIVLLKNLAPDLAKVNADMNQMQQIFLNFITNAREAMDSMPEKAIRELRITTRLQPIDQRLKTKNNFLEIILQDTGPGIPKDIKDRIFDPFFTAKGPTSIGLGLSLSYGIIQDHGGTIEVDSTEGQGATFTVKLPVS